MSNSCVFHHRKSPQPPKKGQRFMVSGQWSIVSGQWSMVKKKQSTNPEPGTLNVEPLFLFPSSSFEFVCIPRRIPDGSGQTGQAGQAV